MKRKYIQFIIIITILSIFRINIIQSQINEHQSFNSFLLNFERINLPINSFKTESCYNENTKKIEHNYMRDFLLSGNLSLDDDLKFRLNKSKSCYGYLVAVQPNFFILTHVEDLAIGSSYSTNYLTTISKYGKFISQITIGQDYSGMVGGTNTTCQIDENLNITVIREDFEYGVETDEDEIINDTWRMRYKILSEGNIILVDSSKIKNKNTRPIPDNIYPSFSPDGNRIAFSSNRSSTYHIWIMDIQGVELKEISNLSWDMHPVWSPDGKQIAFSSYGPTRSGKFQIWIMNQDGSNLHKLSENKYNYGYHPCWSPDGSKIVWTHINHLWIVNIDGSDAKPLTPIPAKKHEVCGSWSPDGRQIVYLAQDAYDHHPISQYEVRIVNSDGTNQRPFLGGIRAKGVDWSPDGKYILLALKNEILKIDLINYNQESIHAFKIPHIDFFDVSSDFKKITFSDSGPDYPGKINIIQLQ